MVTTEQAEDICVVDFRWTKENGIENNDGGY